jgi:hypothetical protein
MTSSAAPHWARRCWRAFPDDLLRRPARLIEATERHLAPDILGHGPLNPGWRCSRAGPLGGRDAPGAPSCCGGAISAGGERPSLSLARPRTAKKRHIPVDTRGLLMHALVHVADIARLRRGSPSHLVSPLPPPCRAGGIVDAQHMLGLDNQMVDCRAREEWR